MKKMRHPSLLMGLINMIVLKFSSIIVQKSVKYQYLKNVSENMSFLVSGIFVEPSLSLFYNE